MSRTLKLKRQAQKAERRARRRADFDTGPIPASRDGVGRFIPEVEVLGGAVRRAHAIPKDPMKPHGRAFASTGYQPLFSDEFAGMSGGRHGEEIVERSRDRRFAAQDARHAKRRAWEDQLMEDIHEVLGGQMDVDPALVREEPRQERRGQRDVRVSFYDDSDGDASVMAARDVFASSALSQGGLAAEIEAIERAQRGESVDEHWERRAMREMGPRPYHFDEGVDIRGQVDRQADLHQTITVDQLREDLAFLTNPQPESQVTVARSFTIGEEPVRAGTTLSGRWTSDDRFEIVHAGRALEIPRSWLQVSARRAHREESLARAQEHRQGRRSARMGNDLQPFPELEHYAGLDPASVDPDFDAHFRPQAERASRTSRSASAPRREARLPDGRRIRPVNGLR